VHQDQAIDKAKGFCLKDVGLLTHECMLKGGLRKEILGKTHHSPYTVYSGSTKMYKDEERSGLEFSTYLSSSLLQATFGCSLMKHFLELCVSRPCIGTTLEGDNVGA
jgi:hypothetical protein